MNKRLIAGFALCALGAFAFNCSSSDDSDGDGGSGGDSGGSGGESSGGKGGSTGKGGSGGKASGGSGGSGGGSGGSGGGSGGSGGGTGSGGSGGMPEQCASVAMGKKFTFEMEADLWQVNAGGNDRVTASTAPALSETQKRGATGKSMALSVNTADGLAGAGADAGADAGTDAGAGGMARRAWFFSVKDVKGLSSFLSIGRTISVWIWIPEGHKLEQMQFVHHSPKSFPAGMQWQSTNALVALTPGQWSQVTLTVPASFMCSGAATNDFHELGLYLTVPAGTTWNGTIYVDDFEISAKP